jgi:hypothetical protein
MIAMMTAVRTVARFIPNLPDQFPPIISYNYRPILKI